MRCSPPGSPGHGTLQESILEWVAIPFSRGSSRPRDQTLVSCIATLPQCSFTNILLPHHGMRAPTAVYPLQHLVWSDFLNFGLSDRCEMAFHDFNSIFLRYILFRKKRAFFLRKKWEILIAMLIFLTLQLRKMPLGNFSLFFS